MTVIGGDVAEGVAVETAVSNAGKRLDGETGAVFERAGRRSETLRVGVREAFLGRGGPAVSVPSPRVRGAIALLAVAAREGRPAGDVLLELADQLDDLRELEGDARRQLATVTGTLTNTAAVFAPLVGGTTVALATGIGAADISGMGAERRRELTRPDSAAPSRPGEAAHSSIRAEPTTPRRPELSLCRFSDRSSARTC